MLMCDMLGQKCIIGDIYVIYHNEVIAILHYYGLLQMLLMKFQAQEPKCFIKESAFNESI